MKFCKVLHERANKNPTWKCISLSESVFRIFGDPYYTSSNLVDYAKTYYPPGGNNNGYGITGGINANRYDGEDEDEDEGEGEDDIVRLHDPPVHGDVVEFVDLSEMIYVPENFL
eukprot:TRINITY_DN13919_c0_g2_i1.p1 TRINITY_DN13919_c0_g2~~TRINITY_DN13919_c0_g2_i1.p1  ORF type:complete len:114 (-),score=33.96 TRINITY_DN13919_c0_g2_i1:125-466(-)